MNTRCVHALRTRAHRVAALRRHTVFATSPHRHRISLLSRSRSRWWQSRNGTAVGPFSELGTLQTTDNLRVTAIRPLLPPACVIEEIPAALPVKQLVLKTRCDISAVLQGASDKLVVLVGPCTTHDKSSAMEYAARLVSTAARHAGELIVVMQLNFELENSANGWKGLINDPDLDGSYQINKGFRMTRQLQLDINRMGLPTGSLTSTRPRRLPHAPLPTPRCSQLPTPHAPLPTPYSLLATRHSPLPAPCSPLLIAHRPHCPSATGSVYLDTITPQFVADLNSLALVGAHSD